MLPEKERSLRYNILYNYIYKAIISKHFVKMRTITIDYADTGRGVVISKDGTKIELHLREFEYFDKLKIADFAVHGLEGITSFRLARNKQIELTDGIIVGLKYEKESKPRDMIWYEVPTTYQVERVDYDPWRTLN